MVQKTAQFNISIVIYLKKTNIIHYNIIKNSITQYVILDQKIGNVILII